MLSAIETSEILGTVDLPNGTSELCATASGRFDETHGRLVLKLNSYLRPADLLTRERHFRADWLPANETITETVDRPESGDLAREIFRRWVRKVRDAAPRLHSESFSP